MTRHVEVSVNQELCVGNGTCLTIASHVFAHNAYRQSEVIDPAGDSEELIMRAAANCPVGAIAVRVVDSQPRPLADR